MPRTTEIQTSASMGTHSVLLLPQSLWCPKAPPPCHFPSLTSISRGKWLPPACRSNLPEDQTSSFDFHSLCAQYCLTLTLPPPLQAPVQSVAHSPVLGWIWLPKTPLPLLHSARDKLKLMHQVQTLHSKLEFQIPQAPSTVHTSLSISIS